MYKLHHDFGHDLIVSGCSDLAYSFDKQILPPLLVQEEPIVSYWLKNEHRKPSWTRGKGSCILNRTLYMPVVKCFKSKKLL